MHYRLLCTGMVAALLAACGTSPPARLYTLSPLAPPAPAAQTEAVSVTVAPVELPDYLDRSQIVTRDGRNGLKIAEFDRWGGALGENVTTVLVENLSALLASDRVVAYPGLSAEAPDFRVGVRILRLDAVPGERVELKAQWLVSTGQEKAEVARGLSTYSERVDDRNYEQLVAAISSNIERLSREIAETIVAAPQASSEAAAGPTGR
jgi:uncharacterized lipoprotein YmbA